MLSHYQLLPLSMPGMLISRVGTFQPLLRLLHYSSVAKETYISHIMHYTNKASVELIMTIIIVYSPSYKQRTFQFGTAFIPAKLQLSSVCTAFHTTCLWFHFHFNKLNINNTARNYNVTSPTVYLYSLYSNLLGFAQL